MAAHDASNQIAVALSCLYCGQTGSITYLESAYKSGRKSGAAIISISAEFYRRMLRDHSGLAEVVCDTCGRVQQGYGRIKCKGRSTPVNVRF
jgi:hypothetical protein